MAFILSKFVRRKVIDKNESSTELKRVLSTIDLTLLGIGSTLGIGIYVLAGSVAKEHAGPAVILSFLVAAFASVLAGLCYAEFGARVPKAGSAYVYSYVCVGELIAFIVGWNLIMEYVIGVASVAKGYSGYIDSLCNEAMKDAFTSITPLHVSFLSKYIDFFAFAITLLVTCVLAFGVKESSLFNNIFTGLNLIVVAFVVIAGSFFAKASNWEIDVNQVNVTLLHNETGKKIGQLGVGGFAPFGFPGIMKGAATCFYGFVGFDCVATTGEEAKNPQKAIPLAIIFSLLFIFLAYFGISTVITMMVPYYLQDSQAPLPQAFMFVDFEAGKWIVTVGAIFGLSTSLLGSMFPMPRVIYAMASDGVLFKFLSKVNPRTQTPFIATIIAGTFGGIMAAIFDLESLIDMMSIGTLTAYTLVAVCVLILRYRKDEDGADDLSISSSSAKPKNDYNWKDCLGLFYNAKTSIVPSKMSMVYSEMIVLTFCITTICFCGVAIFAEDEIIIGHPGYIILLCLFGVVLILSMITLTFQPVSRVKLSFKVPLVPFVPGLSILTNVYLIMKLSGPTWIRFGCWMFVGFLIYGYCLLSGTTDKSYKQHVEELNANKRKYSKILVRGIDNPTLQLSNGEKGKVVLNGKNNNVSATKSASSAALSTKESPRTSNTSIENANYKMKNHNYNDDDENVVIRNGHALKQAEDDDEMGKYKQDEQDSLNKEIQDTLSALAEKLDSVDLGDYDEADDGLAGEVPVIDKENNTLGIGHSMDKNSNPSAAEVIQEVVQNPSVLNTRL